MLPGMMGKDKNKQGGALVVEIEKVEPTEDIGLDMATEEIMSALESKDKEALKVALKSFVEMCKEEVYEEESEDSEME